MSQVICNNCEAISLDDELDTDVVSDEDAEEESFEPEYYCPECGSSDLDDLEEDTSDREDLTHY